MRRQENVEKRVKAKEILQVRILTFKNRAKRLEVRGFGTGTGATSNYWLCGGRDREMAGG